MHVELHDLLVGPGTSLPMVTACADRAVTEALQKADRVLLEPTMSLVVSIFCHKLYSYFIERQSSRLSKPVAVSEILL